MNIDYEPDLTHLRHQSALEEFKASVAASCASFDATIRFAELAIKSLLLLCGGAAIALLSFAGSRGLTEQISLDAYAQAVASFGAAAGGAVTTAAASYLAQSFFSHDYDKTGKTFQGLAILIWLSSLVFFGFGIWQASEAVQKSQWKTELHCDQSAPVKKDAK